jgi:hypothetical protein
VSSATRAGNFTSVLWILVGLSIAMVPLALSLNPARLARMGDGHPASP